MEGSRNTARLAERCDGLSSSGLRSCAEKISLMDYPTKQDSKWRRHNHSFRLFSPIVQIVALLDSNEPRLG
jgi:hypothetical protein